MSATVIAPTARNRVRGNRGVIVAVLAIAVLAVLTALAASSTRLGYLDPEATDPSGARALSHLVTAQGVTVHRTTTVRDTLAQLTQFSDTTLLVVTQGLQSDVDAQRRLGELLNPAARRHTVLLAPGPELLDAFALNVDVSGFATSDVVEPQCSWPVANRAGNALMGGVTYSSRSTPASVEVQAACYPADGRASLLTLESTSARSATTIFGSAAAFTNEHLAENGNAALTMGALGTRPHLVWFIASRTDPDLIAATSPSVSDLVPTWVGLALAQVAVVVLGLAWWRGRALGPVASEPLPVVVRAAEATEGRARLYRKISARGHAAEALRQATMSRLRTDLQLPSTADLYVVAHAIEARGYRDALSVIRVLAHFQPTSDDDLVRLADELDVLEQEVRRS